MNRMKGIKILLVDDEPAILDFLTMGLENEGFEVKTAADGMTAMNTVKTFQPHVAILDVMMPGMDGLEVSRMMKKPAIPRLLCLRPRMRWGFG